jgi:hypothetical protein
MFKQRFWSFAKCNVHNLNDIHRCHACYCWHVENPHKLFVVMGRGAEIIQSSRHHLKILGTRRVEWSKCHAEDPLMFGATVPNSVAMAALRPGFVHPWLCVWPICLPKYVVPSVHYLRHQKRTIQTSLATILSVYIINVASVSKVCYLLSAYIFRG